MSGYRVAGNICRAAHNFGSVKLFKAYVELSESSSSKSLNLRSELQSSGVSLTDCPHNGQKDVADKMILGVLTGFVGYLDTNHGCLSGYASLCRR